MTDTEKNYGPPCWFTDNKTCAANVPDACICYEWIRYGIRNKDGTENANSGDHGPITKKPA
jgi:hypothetical protein